MTHDQAWFGFDYLVEFDDRVLEQLTDADRRRLQRRGDAYFSPRVETVWTDGVSEAPPGIRGLLASPGASSRPLRGAAWKPVLQTFPNWAERCTAAEALAAQIMSGRPDVTAATNQAVALAEAETARRAGVLRARAVLYPDHRERQRMAEELDRAAELARRVEQGLLRPRSELLACTAAVMVSRP